MLKLRLSKFIEGIKLFMVSIKLSDGSVRDYPKAISVFDVAKDISTSLARTSIAGLVDGIKRDLSYLISQNAELTLITEKDDTALEIIRHSTAHLLAHAVKQLYPLAQVTIGPVIENGFYYDFSFERPFTLEDLTQIEKRMEALVNLNLPIERKNLSKEHFLIYPR